MHEAHVKDIYQWLDGVAPFETAEDFDNVGLLVGKMEAPVRNVLVALDATISVIEEAAQKGVQLIITHHPLMLRPIQRILWDTPEGQALTSLIKNNISLIAAHTNMDKTWHSGSACLAENLQLGQVSQADDYLFVIDLRKPLTAGELENYFEKKLSRKVIRFGNLNTVVYKLAVAGGAYDEGYESARSFGAQALLSGEVRHHNAVAAAQSGIVLFEGGHHETEVPMIKPLCQGLQKALDGLEYKVKVFCSSAPIYECRIPEREVIR